MYFYILLPKFLFIAQINFYEVSAGNVPEYLTNLLTAVSDISFMVNKLSSRNCDLFREREEIYTMSQKTSPFYFSNNSVKN